MGRRAGSRTAVGKSSTAKIVAGIFLRPGWRGTALVGSCLLLLFWGAGVGQAQEQDPARLAPAEKPGRPFAAGVAAFDRGEFSTAHDIWLPWAHQGDPAAQRNIAHLYRMGLGVGQNFTQAAAWYRLAADSGLARAQANLAAMYLRGQGVGEDPKQAAYWFAAAATNGHALAQYNLALLYLRGQGVERDEAKAAGWLYLAAQAGHKQALRSLGQLVPAISGPAGPPNPPPPAPKPTRTASAPPATKAPEPVKAASAMAKPEKPEPAKIDIKAVQAVDAETADKAAPQPETEEGGSLIDALASLFTSEPDAEDSRDREVTVDGQAEDVARRDIAAGLVALHAANYTAAKARWQPLAEDGHAEAQYQLGKLYLHTGFSHASRPRGFFWLSKAASQQHAGALASKKLLDGVMNQEERLAARQLVQEVARNNAAHP